MNQGGGIDRGGGGGEADLAGVTTTRVRVCLSRRGCRWADDISSGDRQQASARDASVWVSETEISFLFSSSGMALPSLSSLARFSVQQRVDVWRQVLAWTSESFSNSVLTWRRAGGGDKQAHAFFPGGSSCTFKQQRSKGRLCFRAPPLKQQQERAGRVLSCSLSCVMPG